MNAAKHEVKVFNATVPAGSLVVYTDDEGNETITRTRSEAWYVPINVALVLLDIGPGGYHCDRVRLLVEDV